MWGIKKKNLFGSKRYRIIRQPVKYNNPISRHKHHFSIGPVKLVNIILFVGIASFFYFFIFSSFYDITEIQVSGNQAISTDDILDIANKYLNQNQLFILKNRNIFIFNKNSFKQEVNKLIILADLKIDKILPNTIKLTVKEKNSAMQWLAAGNKYLLDSQGQIIKKYYSTTTPEIFVLNGGTSQENTAAANNGEQFIKIHNLGEQEVNLGNFVLKPENVSFILDLSDKIKGFDYLKFSEIQIPSAWPQYISLIMPDGWQIYFNLEDSLQSQLMRLDLLINQKIKKENLKKLDYIDLRLGESIYYQFKQPKKPEIAPTEATPAVPASN